MIYKKIPFKMRTMKNNKRKMEIMIGKSKQKKMKTMQNKNKK